MKKAFWAVPAAFALSFVLVSGVFAADKAAHGEAKHAAPAEAKHDAKKHDSHATHAPHWSYEGPAGPAHWGDLEEKFAACKSGMSQSPIDLKDTTAAALENLKTDYKESALTLLNNGHTIQVNYAAGSTLTVDGKTFQLAQFHFHGPSEHLIGGKPAPIEVHLVHKNDKGELAVVGVMIKEGKENKLLASIIKNMPKEKNKEKAVAGANINAAELIPASPAYFHYSGSLTTPPCSEGVNWSVMKTPIEASKDQIAKLSKAMGMNARPVQPVNKRAVMETK